MRELPRPAAFLDRDGTLIADPGYLSDPAGVVLLPGTAAALALLRAAGFLTVVVSNQSGIGRGYYGGDTVLAINQRMEALLHAEHAEARLDAIYYCPHAPTDGCSCRKPRPGLFLQAAQELHIDLPASVCFGDSERDILAGTAAGCQRGYRVGTQPSLLQVVKDLLSSSRVPGAAAPHPPERERLPPSFPYPEKERQKC